MSVYIDADAIANWEKGEFDLIGWLRSRSSEPAGIPATVWQQLWFGVFAWEPVRAGKRERTLQRLAGLPVIPFSGAHAERAAKLTAEMKTNAIGFADFQIAATALDDGAEFLTFNTGHFSRVAGLRLAKA
jgi:predicted nucleic acid-binding protein